MATAFTVSVYLSTSSPYVPCISRPAIHHSEVASVNTAMRAVTPRARRHLTSRSTNHAYAIHRTGPTPAKISAVAFTPPITCTTSANIAG